MLKYYSAIAFAAVVLAKQCLEGQQPCIDTCCNTAHNYTCCSYHGGFCADPTSKCCESGPDGLCDANSQCCSGGCATQRQECCVDYICDTGDCCAGGDWSGTACLNSTQQCCQTAFVNGPAASAFTVASDSACCSVTTSRMCQEDEFGHPRSYVGVVAGCQDGHQCCPPSDNLYQSTGAEAFDGGDCRYGDPGNKICADPDKEFCCGGGACATEDLCCDATTDSLSGTGCCHGVPSKNNSCVGGQNFNSCPGSLGRKFFNSTAFVRSLHKDPAKARFLADQLIRSVPDVVYA